MLVGGSLWATVAAKVLVVPAFGDVQTVTDEFGTATFVDFSGASLSYLMKILPEADPDGAENDPGFKASRHRALEITNHGQPGVPEDQVSRFNIYCDSQYWDDSSGGWKSLAAPRCELYLVKGQYAG
jgi:hypothetical protein